MPGPGAVAGAKAAGSAVGRGAAAQSGSAGAAKGGGKVAASPSAAGKGGGQGGGGKSLRRLPSFRSKGGKRNQEKNQELFSSGVFWKLAIAAGGLGLFLVVIVAPLVVLQASSASGCGGDEEEVVPIQTNHQSDPEDMTETQIAIRIYLVGKVMKMTPRQIVTAYATGYVESNMANIYGGDATSSGVFQQQNFSPWTDGGRNRNNIIDTTISFFLQLRKYDHGQSIGDLAAEVQRPAEQYEYRYALWVDEAVSLYNKINRLIGTAAGVKSIRSLQGVTIDGSGLDALSLGAACSAFSATGPANVKQAVTLYKPRSFKTLPANLWAGYGPPEQVDTRIWPDAVWVLTTYHLKATAAREIGHETHGDGTAMDMVPASGNSQQAWDSSALALARALGWTSGCGSNGLTRSAGGLCDLVPAIRFIGYNGYANHGDPAHCPPPNCPAHIHVSWESNCYGCYPQVLGPPANWVKVFPVGVAAPAGNLSPPPLFPPAKKGGKYDGKA